MYIAHSSAGLRKAGWTKPAVNSARREGRLDRLARGIYVQRGTDDDIATGWRADLAALAWRTGGMVSHEAAALLHGLDVPRSWPAAPLTLRVPATTGVRLTGLLRTRTLPSAVHIDAIPVTTLAQTVRDVAARAPVDVVELLLESALRTDPGRPEEWRHDVLAELQVRPAPSALLRAIAARPPGCRPTGSIAETILYQALQDVGLGSFRRQPTVIVEGAPVPFHPDAGDHETGLTVEADGLSSRRTQFSFRSDLSRQNFLIRGLLVLRYPALQIMEKPLEVARNIAEVRAGLPLRGRQWEQNGVRVTVEEPDLWIVERISHRNRPR